MALRRVRRGFAQARVAFLDCEHAAPSLAVKGSSLRSLANAQRSLALDSLGRSQNELVKEGHPALPQGWVSSATSNLQ